MNQTEPMNVVDLFNAGNELIRNAHGDLFTLEKGERGTVVLARAPRDNEEWLSQAAVGEVIVAVDQHEKAYWAVEEHGTVVQCADALTTPTQTMNSTPGTSMTEQNETL